MAVSHRGAISFGMVHIPVGLYTATQDNDNHFNQLCKQDGSRVKYKKVCCNCGKEVSSSDIVKGFEYEQVCAPGRCECRHSPPGNTSPRELASLPVGEHDLQLTEHQVPVLAPGMPVLHDAL